MSFRNSFARGFISAAFIVLFFFEAAEFCTAFSTKSVRFDGYCILKPFSGMVICLDSGCKDKSTEGNRLRCKVADDAYGTKTCDCAPSK